MRIYERIREEFWDSKTWVRDLLSLVSYLLLLYTKEWSPDVPNTCAEGSHRRLRALMAVQRSILRPYHYKQLLTYLLFGSLA